MLVRRKSLWITVIVGAMVLGGAQIAYACHEPSLGSFPKSYRAGDQATFSVSGAQSGAQYSLSIEGHNVAQGTVAGDGGFSGTFTMPDLGTSGTYSAYLVITHEGHSGSGEWPSSQPIQFEAPAAANNSGNSSEDAQEESGSQERSRSDARDSGSEAGSGAGSDPVAQPSAAPVASAVQSAQQVRSSEAKSGDRVAERSKRSEAVAEDSAIEMPRGLLLEVVADAGSGLSHLTQIEPVQSWSLLDLRAPLAEPERADELRDGVGEPIPVLLAAAALLTLLSLQGARRPRPPAQIIAFPVSGSEERRREEVA